MPLALLGLGIPGASAAPFTQAYPFTGSPAGVAGWTDLGSPTPNPWYTSSIGPGGLRMAPTGNGGLVYDNTGDDGQVRSGFQVDAPAGATITRAVLSGVDAVQQHRQRTRVNLLPQPSTGQLTNTESWGRSTINDGDALTSTITLTPLAGSTATGLQVRHLTVACGNPALNQPPCEPVPSNTPAHARVAGVTLTLDDPSAPVATVGLPPGGWTNAGSVAVTASGQDPQSGISRLALQVRSGSATRRPVVGTWPQDTTGATLPGWATSRSGSSNVSLPHTGSVTIATVARNGAQVDATSAPATIRVDRNPPKITWPRKLEGGQSATVRDAEAGLATLNATGDGRAVPTTCAAGAKQCKVKIPTAADGTLRIRATDQAGNGVTSERKVAPKPRRGGGGAGAGKPGRSDVPSKRPGGSKPGRAYCVKHPTSRACRARQPAKPARPSLGDCGRSAARAEACRRPLERPRPLTPPMSESPRPDGFELIGASRARGCANDGCHFCGRNGLHRSQYAVSGWVQAVAPFGGDRGYAAGRYYVKSYAFQCRDGSTVVAAQIDTEAEAFCVTAGGLNKLKVTQGSYRRDDKVYSSGRTAWCKNSQRQFYPSPAHWYWKSYRLPKSRARPSMDTLYTNARGEPITKTIVAGRKNVRFE